MRFKKQNHLDSLIDNIAKQFSKVKDFEKLQETEEGRKIFSLIIKNAAELQTFETLFLNYYIPATNKSIADSWFQITNSKYKSLLQISKTDLKKNIYETIRLGYVGLSHKYESYLKSLIEGVNFLLNDLQKEFDLLPIETYCQKQFGINLYKSHHLFPITSKINYISNCIKHYDGFAIKEPIPKEYRNYPRERKIEIEKEEFKIDIQRLKIHSEKILRQSLMIGFKQLTDKQILESADVMNDKLKINSAKLEEQYKVVLSEFME